MKPAVTEDLQQARARLEQQWRQRLERATHQANRAARQFQAVEPENRLVARTLEKNWETALLEQEQLRREFDEFQRTQPFTLTEDQRSLIRHLAEDIPASWNSPTTTPEDRQQIVRMSVIKLFTHNPVFTDDWRLVAPGLDADSGIYFAGPTVTAR